MLLVALAVVLAVSANGEPMQPAGSRIRGGENAEIEQYPYQVSLEYKSYRSEITDHRCGGFIISPRHVLTAGHCIIPQLHQVRAGTSFRERGGSVHAVKAIVRHEDYYIRQFGNDSEIPYNDLAILRLSPDFELDGKRQVAELSAQQVEPGKMAVVTGWGDTSGYGQLAYQLQSLVVPVISKSDCSKQLRSIGGLGAGQMCTKYEGDQMKDACGGDSGGPLALDGKIVGMVSYGDNCTMLTLPGMYTEVAYYYDWIQSHLDF